MRGQHRPGIDQDGARGAPAIASAMLGAGGAVVLSSAALTLPLSATSVRKANRSTAIIMSSHKVCVIACRRDWPSNSYLTSR